jgi:NitT/TauT family transport system substrate-binding protein
MKNFASAVPTGTGSRFRASALAIMVATGLALTGCASGSASEEGGSSTADPSLTKVSVAYSSPGASYSDLYVAASEGIFKSNGIDVDLRALNSSSQIIPAILSGSVDIAVGSATDTTAAIMKGSELTIVAVTRPVFNLQVYAEKSIKSVQDLKGKKIGLTSPGSQSDQALTAMLEANGMSREDVEPTYVKSIPGQLAALQSGSVSAILAQPPQGVEAINNGFPVLLDLTDIPFPSAAVVVANQFLKDHADLVDAFVKSEVESLTLLQTDKAAVIAAIKQYSGVKDDDAAAYAYKFFKGVWTTDPTVDPALIQKAFETTAAATGDPVPSDIGKFIDNSFVEKYAGVAATATPTAAATPAG